MEPGSAPRAIQDAYSDEFAHCYGCGRLNPHGLHIRSVVEGAEAVTTIAPRPEHTSVPGFVYGGFIASILDCHMIATAAAAASAADGGPVRPFVTASLKVDYLKPTPVGGPVWLRARSTSVAPRKVLVAGELSAGGVKCARGELVAVLLPASMGGHGRAP